VPLISCDDLADRLEDPGVRICDVRWYLADHDQGRREYAAGHLPGAVFVDVETVLTAPEGPGRHPLPHPAEFTAALGRLGITPNTEVLAYDDSGGSIAARLWWMLRSIGHTGVRVLDGGYAAWIAAGHPVTNQIPEFPETTYPPVAAWTGAVDAEQVALAIGHRPIVDARAAERYRGEIEPIDPRAGHIPTAVNLPHLDNLAPDGHHLPPATLRRRFAAVGDRPIVYCGSGVTACHDLLAMAVAGIDGAILYEGSWSDWCSDPERPMATG
jgi:thiosulfate/3-mercaptopyruvate sulfurtransferase